MALPERRRFWYEALTLGGSVTPRVVPLVVVFGGIAGLICLAVWYAEDEFGARLAIEVAPYEVAGAVLGMVLVFRTNAGYDRWWEGRKLWGGIVNQCRNLAVGALAYGPADPVWREQITRWVAAFPHAARQSLRGERRSGPLDALLGDEAAAEVVAAEHMPSFVALRLALLLREAVERRDMPELAFLQVDRERALLIDHIGACERILKTPLPRAQSIIIRRFLLAFLLTLPLALLHKLGTEWLVPLITMAVAYPLLAIDRIGVELENPFSTASLNHLPLDDISATIERNVLALARNSTPANR